MESNDYWTHVGLATAFFAVVVGPRLFSPGHTVNSVVFILGAMSVIVVASVARHRTKAASDSLREERP